jgi:adenine-specific DNA-methyltransferase
MTHSHTEMTGSSLDITEQRKNELKQLFPGVFTETKNDQGELVHTLDFERLKAELGEFSDIYDNRRERYGMDWPGKRDCLRLVQEPSHATLTPCREESVDFDTTENLFIEGDNLEVLKLLQKSYYGQVKMIYIDPPYNTGKEFIYPDNFSESLDTYLQYAGLKETGGEGRKWSTNSANEGRFHTKWLNMMFPRLYLARNLLREDGVIFISIDDNEVENLRRMCDEIFGEENFVGAFIWKRRQNADNRNISNVSSDHEYMLLYSKAGKARLNGISIDVSKYKNPDNDPRGPWASIDLTGLANASQRPNLHYELMDTSTGNIYPPNPNRGWSKSKGVIEKMIQEERIIFPSKKSGRPREKKFLSDLQSTFTGFSTVFDNGKVGYTTNGSKEIRKIMGGNYFDFPKPTNLLKYVIDQATNDDDLILDFFAGSASTLDSCFQLQNKKRLRCISIQLPEKISEDSEAFSVGFKSIADVGKERIRRAGNSIRQELDGQLNLESNQSLDFGFKVLKLNQSNFKQWQAPDKSATDEALLNQIALGLDYIDPNATQEDLLYELLIKAGVMPTEKIEPLEWAGHKIFSVAEGSLLVYLELAIDQALIDAVLAKAPSQFICLDSAFQGNDQLKTNAVKTFATFNSDKQGIDRIEFTTV